jgi:hypothetical protein
LDQLVLQVQQVQRVHLVPLAQVEEVDPQVHKVCRELKVWQVHQQLLLDSSLSLIRFRALEEIQHQAILEISKLGKNI